MNASEKVTKDDVVSTMRSEGIVMLSTAGKGGKIVSHPMTAQEVTDDADVWFFVGLQGDQADALRASAQVNLAFAKGGSWLSVSGTAEFVDDPAKVDELWDGQVDAYFEQGKDDPNLGLLKVTSESAEFWGVAGGRAAVLASIVKSKVTGSGTPGMSGTTEL